MRPFFLKTIWRGALLFATILGPFSLIRAYYKTDYTDFLVYYRAAERFLSGQWGILYSLQDGSSPFRYAPPFLLLFAPFACVSYPTALFLWIFLQYGSFLLGLAVLRRILSQVSSIQSLTRDAVLGASFLLTFRYFMDCLSIGQVTGFMFLAFALSLEAWVNRKSRFLIFLSFPAALKIGPAFLFGLMADYPLSRKAWLGLLAAPPLFYLGALQNHAVLKLWQDWFQIVLQDSQYYDASHYGSQSVYSALLRLTQEGILPTTWVSPLYLSFSILGCIAILGIWILRTPLSGYGRALFYSLGLLASLWFMPETFKYSLTILCFPLSLYLCRLRKENLWIVLFFVAAISLAGKDLVGDRLFFSIQHYSLPLVATFWLGAWVLKQAWKESYFSFERMTFLPIVPLSPWLPSSQAVSTPMTSVFWISPLTDSESNSDLSSELNADLFSFLKGHSDLPVEWIEVKEPEGESLRDAFLRSKGSYFFVFQGIELKDRITTEPSQLKDQILAFIREASKQLSTFSLIQIRGNTHVFAFRRELGECLLSRQTFKGQGFLDQMSHMAQKPETLGFSSFPFKDLSPHSQFSLMSVIRKAFAKRLNDLNSSRPDKMTADDWGLSPEVNEAILALAKRGVIQRVSLMADQPFLLYRIRDLLDLPHIETGIHFNLTYKSIFSSPQNLFWAWLKDFLHSSHPLKKRIQDEFEKQMTLFQNLEIPIRYFDSHEHIHVAPGLIMALSSKLKAFGVSRIRVPYHSALFFSRHLPLAVLALLLKFTKKDFLTSSFFHPKSSHLKSPSKMAQILKKHWRSEMLFHPSRVDDFGILGITDSYRKGRLDEYRALLQASYFFKDSL